MSEPAGLPTAGRPRAAAHPVSALTPRDPNGEGLPLWPAYDAKERYLRLDLNLSVGQSLRAPEVAFWAETLPLLMSTSEGCAGPLSSLALLSALLPFLCSCAH